MSLMCFLCVSSPSAQLFLINMFVLCAIAILVLLNGFTYDVHVDWEEQQVNHNK